MLLVLAERAMRALPWCWLAKASTWSKFPIRNLAVAWRVVEGNATSFSSKARRMHERSIVCRSTVIWASVLSAANRCLPLPSALMSATEGMWRTRVSTSNRSVFPWMYVWKLIPCPDRPFLMLAGMASPAAIAMSSTARRPLLSSIIFP